MLVGASAVSQDSGRYLHTVDLAHVPPARFALILPRHDFRFWFTFVVIAESKESHDRSDHGPILKTALWATLGSPILSTII